MSKTPYEIRFDVLAMAEERLKQQYFAAMNQWELGAKRDHTGNVIDTSGMPTWPTDQQIIDLANSLKNFVDGK